MYCSLEFVSLDISNRHVFSNLRQQAFVLEIQGGIKVWFCLLLPGWNSKMASFSSLRGYMTRIPETHSHPTKSVPYLRKVALKGT